MGVTGYNEGLGDRTGAMGGWEVAAEMRRGWGSHKGEGVGYIGEQELVRT